MCKISSHFSFLPDFCNDTFHVNIVNIKLASQFFTHMTSSLLVGVIIDFPLFDVGDLEVRKSGSLRE